MNDHRGDDVFELSIGVRAQNRNDQPDFIPIVLAGGYGRNRKIFDAGPRTLRQRGDTRYKKHEGNCDEATQAYHRIHGRNYGALVLSDFFRS